MKENELLYKKIRNLNHEELKSLADEIRRYIVDVTLKNSGHLASNLGVVEFTLALYRIFDPFEDIIIWDTGHQAYVHKLLTGRWDEFKTIRTFGGLSGFTNLKECECDRYGAGHAGTAIAASLGYELGNKFKNQKKNIIVVLGDGAFTCGMSMESMNQIKALNSNLKIILLNNDMSISPNVGAMARFLSKIRVKREYTYFKKHLKELLEHTQTGYSIEKMLKKIRDGIKYTFYNSPTGLFEGLGLKYYGPVDGHNIKELELFLKFIKEDENEPVILHVVVKKGKGYEPSEKNPTKYHGVSGIKEKKGISYSKIVGNILKHLAPKYEFLTFTGAMEEGTGLYILKEKFSKRVIDMGITEPSIVTAAGGVALTGVLPIVIIYSTFLQRAFDSIIHDIALQNLPVLFLIDRAGLVGEDGPTHHGVFDIAYLRFIPNVNILTPLDPQDLANTIYTLVKNGIKQPTFVRYPRDRVNIEIDEIIENLKETDFKWKMLKNSGSDVAVLFVGTTYTYMYDDIKDLDVDIFGVRSIKPLDEDIITLIKSKYKKVVTVEEGVIKGGFYEEILSVLNGLNTKVIPFGIKDEFIPHGTREELLEYTGLTGKKLREYIFKMITGREMEIK